MKLFVIKTQDQGFAVRARNLNAAKEDFRAYCWSLRRAKDAAAPEKGSHVKITVIEDNETLTFKSFAVDSPVFEIKSKLASILTRNAKEFSL